MSLDATLLVTGIGELATPIGHSARFGAEMGKVRVVRDAAIVVNVETIAWAGPKEEMPTLSSPPPETIDAGGRTVVPGFIDSHTHFVFGGYRADEFFWRASGLKYMDIHRKGGGIANSVEATRRASAAELISLGIARLERMLELGITTVEGKSGYGLETETELKQLSVMKSLSGLQPVDIVPTFMGPHSVPAEFKENPSAYIDLLIGETLPAVREMELAKFCDVFCERGVFGIDDSRRYLEAAKNLGFGLKLHADEIERIGGAGLAAELGAVSADHLLKASPDDLDAMAKAGVVATCLPITAFSLREPYVDARSLIDRGSAVAVATDFNPGSCPSQSMPLAAALSALYMGMCAEEILTAMTLNGAAAVGLAGDRGSIEPGKLADLLILDAPSYRHLAYEIGMNVVGTVIKRGKVVSRRD